MRDVLFLIGDLNYSFAARQLTLLATQGLAETHRLQVAVIGKSAPWVETLRAAGISVHVLNWTRSIDPRPFASLVKLLRECRPAVVHAWDPSSLRMLALVKPLVSSPTRIVASGLLPPLNRPGLIDWLLLRRLDHVLAFGEHEAGRYRALGLVERQVVKVAPAVVPYEAAPAKGLVSGPALPPEARVILNIGPVTMVKGFRDSVWVLDMLNLQANVHHLVLVGPASEWHRVQYFAQCIEAEHRVHCVGPVDNLGPWLARAELVWVPSWTNIGRGAVLEAMAAGKPVIANRWPDLAELIVPGETGFLVPAEDKAAMGRQSFQLLEDRGLLQRLGDNSRRRAVERFNLGQLVAAARGLYG